MTSQNAAAVNRVFFSSVGGIDWPFGGLISSLETVHKMTGDLRQGITVEHVCIY